VSPSDRHFVEIKKKVFWNYMSMTFAVTSFGLIQFSAKIRRKPKSIVRKRTQIFVLSPDENIANG